MDAIFRDFSPESMLIKGKPNNLFTPTASQQYPLGARYQYGDRVYHYAYAGGTALAAGKLVYPAALPVEVNKAVSAAAAVGDTMVTVTTVAAQLYLEGGTMIVNDEAGEGTSYGILYSEANASTATSTNVYLTDPLTAALTTSSEVELYCSPYYDLDVLDAVTDHAVGVPSMAVTANYYFWVQTWGPASVLAGANTTVGAPLIPHTTDGAVAIYTAANATAMVSNIVGFAMTAGTSGEYNAVFLRVAP